MAQFIHESHKRRHWTNLTNDKCSIILVSPKNEILLLHRVQTSSSFPSAHVFPGGNISEQDGECPPAGDPKRHDEAVYYRRAAIRELFEESGILLARDLTTGQMITLDEAEREKGRQAIHRQEITFIEWLKKHNAAAEPDIGRLDARRTGSSLKIGRIFLTS